MKWISLKGVVNSLLGVRLPHSLEGRAGVILVLNTGTVPQLTTLTHHSWLCVDAEYLHQSSRPYN